MGSLIPLGDPRRQLGTGGSEFSCLRVRRKGLYPLASIHHGSRLLLGEEIPWPFRPALCAGRVGSSDQWEALQDGSQAVQL